MQKDIAEFERYFDRLWPILRSITGKGVRETHSILSELVPLKRIEIPSGKKVFDWTIPKEWVVRDAYLIDPAGEKIIDVKDNNLHLLNYSMPFKGKIPLDELQNHLYSFPEVPQAIPYKTSYYSSNWGFCLSENQRRRLKKGHYEVFIDTDFIDGSLTISEAVLPGETKDEVLISTYTCHPSLANNELCGMLAAAFLYRRLSELKRRRLTYRFVLLPETIGSIVYLDLYGDHFKKHMIAGYVMTCLGAKGPFVYKRSRRGNTIADRSVEYVFKGLKDSVILDFFPHSGSDERQYCSPGFDLPVGSIMRLMYGEYKEYHTSLDNRDFISFEAMQESTDLYYKVCLALEKNVTYKNRVMFCEPQLGKYGLYSLLGASQTRHRFTEAILWLLNLSDGNNDLLAIAEKSRLDIDFIYKVSQDCLEKKLIELVQ
jgi:aminopeptidase-like protein